jgi:hypothetical protein
MKRPPKCPIPYLVAPHGPIRKSTRTLALATALAVATFTDLGAGVAGADEPTHEIHKTTPPVTVGVPAKASVTVEGKNGWHVNEAAPITMNVKADPGVDLPKLKMARADLASSSKQSARFDIPFSASAAGKKTITAETRFVMCQEQACKPVKETVLLEIEVASAAPSTAPGKSTRTKKNAPSHATP